MAEETMRVSQSITADQAAMHDSDCAIGGAHVWRDFTSFDDPVGDMTYRCLKCSKEYRTQAAKPKARF